MAELAASRWLPPGWPRARRRYWLALIAAVALTHLVAIDGLIEGRFGWGDADKPPPRIEVVFVRELAQAAPPTAPAPRPAPARRPRAVAAAVPASAPASEPEAVAAEVPPRETVEAVAPPAPEPVAAPDDIAAPPPLAAASAEVAASEPAAAAATPLAEAA